MERKRSIGFRRIFIVKIQWNPLLRFLSKIRKSFTWKNWWKFVLLFRQQRHQTYLLLFVFGIHLRQIFFQSLDSKTINISVNQSLLFIHIFEAFSNSFKFFKPFLLIWKIRQNKIFPYFFYQAFGKFSLVIWTINNMVLCSLI